jgi:simple sugar transport system permease protein
MFVYCVAGVCSALAGIIVTADIQGADANNAGLWLELDAILAVVIGGAALTGGRFSLLLSIIGALIIQALSTTIIMSGVPPTWNLLIKSLVIVAVLLLQSPVFRRRTA